MDHVWSDPAAAPRSDTVWLQRARVVPRNGLDHGLIDVSTPLTLEFEYWNLRPGVRLNLSLVLYNEEGIPVFNTFPSPDSDGHMTTFSEGLFRSRCEIPGGLLNNGLHRVQLHVVQDQGIVLSRHDDILVFDVLDAPDRRGAWFGKWIGAVRPNLAWETEQLKSGRSGSAQVNIGTV
jgi:lipopolysaccharide transport system ATP-binding protein